MSKNSEHHDTYIIPPNFIEGSTLFGGMFKIRNVIEAGVLAAAVGVPVFYLDLSLTVRVIILCLTALPLALFALMGVAGEPLSSYIIAFFKWLKPFIPDRNNTSVNTVPAKRPSYFLSLSSNTSPHSGQNLGGLVGSSGSQPHLSQR